MRAYIYLSVFIILGLVSIVLKTHLDPQNNFYPYLDQLPAVFLVSGVLGLLYKIVEQKEEQQNLRRLFRIHDSVEKAGLLEIVHESQGYNYTQLIAESKKLSIVVNDGKRWVGNNSVKLSERFSTKGTITELFTVDPDSSFVRPLAGKVGSEEAELREKIKSTWKLLKESYQESTRQGELTIYALKNYPTESVYHTERFTVITPYQISSGRTIVPVFVYRQVTGADTMHDFVGRDLESLRKESKVIFSKEQLKKPKPSSVEDSDSVTVSMTPSA
jgi:hypothetical protein